MRPTLSKSTTPMTACVSRSGFVLSLLVVTAFALNAATTVLNPRNLNSITSRSGQFVVTAPAPGTTSFQITRRDFRYDPNALHLEAPALAVTCDRIKDAVLRELGMHDQWRGKVYVYLMPAATVPPEIIVRHIQYTDGWQYKVEVPDQVEPQRLVRAFVQVTLLEMANRSGTARSAEIPIWLMEGLTTQLLAADGDTLILQTQKLEDLHATKFESKRLTNSLATARERLRQQNAYSFADLSLPGPAQLNGAGWENYRFNSQLLVSELLRFRDGPACLQTFIGQLPNYLNSQLAFLNAFQGHFQSMLDVEKWWSVVVVGFTGRDQQLKWSATVCLQRLDEILRAPVEIRANTNALPTRAELQLQGMFEKLDYTRQKLVLQTAFLQLQQLEWNAPPDMFKLVKDYRSVITTYMQKREKAAGANDKGQAASIKIIVRDTIKQLDMLDVIRDDFRQYGSLTPAATAQNSPK